MERLAQRLEVAQRALTSLVALASEPYSTVVRDASIQRFEYTVEAVWKAAKAVLADRYGVDVASPKAVVRAAMENGLLTEEQARLALAMVDHRNLTSHTYNEALADEIFAALPAYRALMQDWLGALSRS